MLKKQYVIIDVKEAIWKLMQCKFSVKQVFKMKKNCILST